MVAGKVQGNTSAAPDLLSGRAEILRQTTFGQPFHVTSVILPRTPT